MNRIFKSIDEKLTPSSGAEQELFNKAAELKAGEKYMGSAEEVFLSKGIIPEEFEEAPAPARIKTGRLAYAAAAAAIVLVVGGTLFLGISSHKGLDTDSSNTEQTARESKTDETDLREEDDFPQDITKQWIAVDHYLNIAYDEYKKAGSDYTRLPKLRGFYNLTNYGADSLRLITYDMYQNGEIDDEHLFIAENAYNYVWRADCVNTNRFYLTENDDVDDSDYAYRFFADTAQEYDIKHDLSSYLFEEGCDPEREELKALFDKLEKQKDYNKSSEFFELISKGKGYGDYETEIAAMYLAGDLNDTQLKIAFQAAKHICKTEIDAEAALEPESEIAPACRERYVRDMTERPKERLCSDAAVNSWVYLKICRIADNMKKDGYDMHDDVNYKSLKALGTYTLQRALLYNSCSFEDHTELQNAALQAARELGWGFDKDLATFEELLGYAGENCVCPDIFKGVYDGRYRDGGCYLKNRDSFDLLLAALKEFDEKAGEAKYETPTDEQISEAKKTALAYTDLYQCREGMYDFIDTSVSQKLSIVIPKQEESTLIIGGKKYTNVDKQAFEDIRLALYDLIKPYDTETQNREYVSAYAEIGYIAGMHSVKKTYNDQKLCDMIFELACYCDDNEFGCAVKPDEIPNDNTGHEMTLELKNEKGETVYTIYTPLIDGYEVYINGVKYNSTFNDTLLIYGYISQLEGGEN